MIKNNKKGFAIMEILAVTVVIMVIFTTVYSNFLPTTAEFEKRIVYNDVSSQYAAFYMRKIFKDVDLTSIEDSNYYVNAYNNTGGCSILTGTKQTKCNEVASALGIEEIIITKYNLTDFKENANYNGKLAKYIKYLPKFLDSGTTEEQYRLIIKTGTGYATTELRVFKSKDANEPLLTANMLPVYYSGGAWKVANETNTEKTWYNYDEAKWANAVTIKEDYRDLYFDENGLIIASDETNIDMNHINTMWVWIPRYKYTIFNYNLDGTNQSEVQKINIEFESDTDSTGTVECNDTRVTTSEICWDETNGGTRENNGSGINVGSTYSTYVHSAFNFGGTELTGIWVGKFENGYEGNDTSYDTNSIVILPNVKSNVYTYADKIFLKTRKMELDDKNIYGFTNDSSSSIINPIDYINGSVNDINDVSTALNDTNNIDTHMMKNAEWGVVTYLAYSKYGLYHNSENLNQLYHNNSFSMYTGRCSGLDDLTNTSTGTYEYDTTEGTKASTTYNIFGVYDMKGGAGEFTMGVIVDDYGNPYSAGTASGQLWSLMKNGVKYSWHPESRYYDSYLYQLQQNTTLKIGKLGDATKEFYCLSSDDSSKNCWMKGETAQTMIYVGKEVFSRGGSWSNNKYSDLGYYTANDGLVESIGGMISSRATLVIWEAEE